jgi:hypothetical protein
MDVADILRKEAELTLRHDYLQKANLFKADVEKMHIIDVRDEYLDWMSKYADI